MIGYAPDVWYGFDVAISKDGSRLVVGATKNDQNGTDAGKVYVYDNVDNDWSVS